MARMTPEQLLSKALADLESNRAKLLEAVATIDAEVAKIEAAIRALGGE